jgi:hypothetical protein
MTFCPMELNDGLWQCPECGYRFPRPLPKPPIRNCLGFPAKSRGLGDTIAKVTAALGIRPCGGCKKRQATLNRMVSYGRRHDADP